MREKEKTSISNESSSNKLKYIAVFINFFCFAVLIYFATKDPLKELSSDKITRESCPDCFQQELLFSRNLREISNKQIKIPQHGFKKLHKAKSDVIHDLIFEVKHKNIEQLEELVNQISDPLNKEKYGKFLTQKEVDDIIGNKEGITAMINYFKNLKLNTPITISHEKMIQFNSPVHAHSIQESINIQPNGEKTEEKKKIMKEKRIAKMKIKRGKKKMKMKMKKKRGVVNFNVQKNVNEDSKKKTEKSTKPSSILTPSTTLTTTKSYPVEELKISNDSSSLSSTDNIDNMGYDYFYYFSSSNSSYNSSSNSTLASSRTSSFSYFRVLNEDTAFSSGFVIVRAPLAAWEEILQTEFFRYSGYTAGNRPIEVHRAKSYILPLEIRSHVRSVLNSIHFPVKIENYLVENSFSNLTSNEENRKLQSLGFVNPGLLNSYYNIDTNNGHGGTSQGIYAGLNERLSLRDLFTFQTRNGIPVQTISRAIGGNVMDNACTVGSCSESNLDIQYLMGVSRTTPTTFYYWGGSDPWLDWITTMASMADPPKVVSISYGSSEHSISSSYINSFNVQALKLSARGVTIVASSGNNGANSASCGYTPQFPASSPYITAVGGTQGPEKGQPEVVCSSITGGTITSGGGFSNKFPAPSWQVNSIMGYFRNTPIQPAGGFNGNGRGYPDVSVLANSYEIITNDSPSYVSGTSAATPVVAGMISLVNAQRIARGKSTLGWINPALYRYASFYIRDITSGNNRCPINKQCCAQGFEASRGWDPVSGLGSIDFSKFRQVFTNI